MAIIYVCLIAKKFIIKENARKKKTKLRKIAMINHSFSSVYLLCLPVIVIALRCQIVSTNSKEIQFLSLKKKE